MRDACVCADVGARLGGLDRREGDEKARKKPSRERADFGLEAVPIIRG